MRAPPVARGGSTFLLTFVHIRSPACRAKPVKPGNPRCLSHVVAVQQAAQDELVPLLSRRAAQRCRQLTTALYRVGRALNAEYERLKAQRGLLDYDDLIRRTSTMLSDGDAAQWVAWKLDNGISHMLLDEAQDTSPAQWQLLRRLGDEFFETASAEGVTRTLFVVGDFKQSIYSFQGADPAVMGQNRIDIRERAAAQQVPLREVALDVSFRSSRPVLELVTLPCPTLPASMTRGCRGSSHTGRHGSTPVGLSRSGR